MLEDDFRRQLEDNLTNDIHDFITSPRYSNIRIFYKKHFDKITALIIRFGAKQSVEDISLIEKNMTVEISENVLFLKEVNKAILNNKLTLENIR